MTMQDDASRRPFAALSARAARLVDALADPVRGRRTALALIAVYALLWWCYALIAKSAEDIHFDMAEVFSWSLNPSFGYAKHPPLPAWVAGLWFAVFPRADWSYYLLAMVCVGVGLWFVWLITARYVTGSKRAVGLVLLMLTPMFNLLPLKFNANAPLISVWAAASYLFLRSYSERTLLWGALAGLGAALAMLTKYWSIFLIAGFIAAALADRRRGAYLRSPAPWAAIVVGALLLAPNIASLIAYDFAPFSYATVAHATANYSDVVGSVIHSAGGLLYLSGALLAFMLATRPKRQTWRALAWPDDNDRRLMLLTLCVSFLVPIAVALALRTRLSSLWVVSAWAMLPALLLAPGIDVTRRAAAHVVIAAYAVALLAIVAAPAVALVTLKRGAPNAAAYYALLAREVDNRWAAVSRAPLRYVVGRENLAWGCTFYCRDRPQALPNFSFVEAPWIDRTALRRDGFAALCEVIDQLCLADARSLADGSGREETVTLSRSLFGITGEPRQFSIMLVPPRP
jgi:4-amino-4-deoxy-L-arabinose transferase-like glycosyltransferase